MRKPTRIHGIKPPTFALKPSKLQKKEEVLEKGTFIFAPNSGMHQTLVLEDKCLEIPLGHFS